ncbi:CHAT domain-containing protein [Nostoc punctiforme UO1]|uniref:CHAT domain-containing protein n=1 Tax=Nostoc punctiforme TaxID=272131 RepID=UPI0030AFE013
MRGRASIEIESVIDSKDQKKQLQQLHKLLIDPIADILPKDPDSHVIFIPQGQLFLVPFPALQDAKGKYLIEKHTILTAPAIQVLDLTNQQKLKPHPANLQTALIVGNPTMPKITTKLGDLPQQLSNLQQQNRKQKKLPNYLKLRHLQEIKL